MWTENGFLYSVRLLMAIAESYVDLYEGLPVGEHVILDPLSLAEFKADFDNALDGIGRGRWRGLAEGDFRGGLHPEGFKLYRNFGASQRIVIADILGLSDAELARLHFSDVRGLRGYAYYRMKIHLNGGQK